MVNVWGDVELTIPEIVISSPPIMTLSGKFPGLVAVVPHSAPVGVAMDIDNAVELMPVTSVELVALAR